MNQRDLSEQDMNSTVWRYMPLSKFISLLTFQALWFSKFNILQDKSEGDCVMTGKIIRVECPSIWEHTVTVRILVNDICIGKAHLTRNGDSAILADIIIPKYERSLVPFLNWPKVTVDNRGKGYGTILLRRVLEYCREHGVSTLSGRMHGDIERLKRWYRKSGFEILEDNYIQARINA